MEVGIMMRLGQIIEFRARIEYGIRNWDGNWKVERQEWNMRIKIPRTWDYKLRQNIVLETRIEIGEDRGGIWSLELGENMDRS